MAPWSSYKDKVLWRQVREKHGSKVSDIKVKESYDELDSFEYLVRVKLNDKFNYKVILYKINWKPNSERWRLFEKSSTGWN